jgi:MoaA/NifB/PqqE/SkfB family radical SAM enzyme
MASFPALDRRKRIASLFLTPDCDMGCRFCASETGFSVMSFDEAESLLRELRRRSVADVVFGGGEPFLWPHDLSRLTRLARDLGFRVQVCTNGVSMPGDFATIESIDRYILPLESMESALHDELRRARDSHHARTLERMESLAGSERELTVSTVVTRRNLDRLQPILDHLLGLAGRGVRLHAWHLYRFLPIGRGGSAHGAELAIDAPEFRRACAPLQSAGAPFAVYRRPDMMNSRTVEFFWYEDGRLRTGSEAAGVSLADGASG